MYLLTNALRVKMNDIFLKELSTHDQYIEDSIQSLTEPVYTNKFESKENAKSNEKQKYKD